MPQTFGVRKNVFSSRSALCCAVPALAEVRTRPVTSQDVPGCSYSVPLLIDRPCFIELPTNFLERVRRLDKIAEFRAMKRSLSPKNAFSEGGFSQAIFSDIPFIQGRLRQNRLIPGAVFKTAWVCLRSGQAALWAWESLSPFISLNWKPAWEIAEARSGSACEAGMKGLEWSDMCPNHGTGRHSGPRL